MKRKIGQVNLNLDFVIYTIFFLLIIIHRYLVLQHFGFKFTDSDQNIMWMALQDYSNGIFHEPRFYGQSYNSMLEALIAVPLYRAGIPPYMALPIVTSILTLLPFIILSLMSFRNGERKLSLIILSLPLLLAPEYSFITTISRGFVTGIFVTTLGFIKLFNADSDRRFFYFGLFAVIGYSLNANALLLSLPFFLYLLTENIKNIKFYLYLFFGMFPGLIFNSSLNYYYKINPAYDFHRMCPLEFSFSTLGNGIKKLDPLFNAITPLFWHAGSLILLIFLCLSILLFRRNEKKKAFMVIILSIGLLLTSGINKVYDATGSIFYSYSRMYLAIPVLLCVVVSFFTGLKSRIVYFYLLIPLFYFYYHVIRLDNYIESNTNSTNVNIVGVYKVDQLKKECDQINRVCKKYDINLVLIGYAEAYNYGCPVCAENFPKTLKPMAERRTWRLIEDERKSYNNILLIDFRRNLSEEYSFIKKIDQIDDCYFIENNYQKTMDLLDSIKINYRNF